MRGLLILLSALFLLESTDGNRYDQLSQHETNIIDKAIKEANQNYGKDKHLDFAAILNSDYDKRMLNVLLKPTSCGKSTPIVHKRDCEIQKDARPQVSCIDCHGDMSCFLLREKEKIKKALNQCSSTGRIHNKGGAHTMFLKTENGQETGCLGCV